MYDGWHRIFNYSVNILLEEFENPGLNCQADDAVLIRWGAVKVVKESMVKKAASIWYLTIFFFFHIFYFLQE